jgi:hypothetical protein
MPLLSVRSVDDVLMLLDATCNGVDVAGTSPEAS